MMQGDASKINPSAASKSMQSGGTSLYNNDLLARRQADVRSALNELYGTGHQHDNQGIENVHQRPMVTRSMDPVTLLDYGNDDTDVQSLSFDPLVLQDSDDGEFHPLYNHNQNHDGGNNDGQGGDGNDSSSVSSFSLSELCDSSIGLGTHDPHLNAIDNTHGNTNRGSNMQIMHSDSVRLQMDELKEENNQLQEELEIMQKAERALLSPTKYQVELDSMRYVAEQVQVEADEKIQILQRERDAMSYELEHLKQQQQQDQEQNQIVYPSEPSTKNNDGRIWGYAFHSLLEQICLLEESGLRMNAALRMDDVIRDALVGIETESGLLVESSSLDLEANMGMSEYLERLAKGCGNSNVLDSIVSREGTYEDHMNDTNRQGTDSSSIARDSHESESQETGKYVSIGVDTDDLKSMGLFSPVTSSVNASSSISMTPFLQQTVSELQLENASLKGSNEHMKEQVIRYKQQVQVMKESSAQDTSFVSPAFGVGVGSQYSEKNQNHKLKNAQLQQEINIITENQRVVEEENYNVVQRCVELENVAEDATHECEELILKLAGAEDELQKLQDDREKLLTLHADYEEATSKHELEKHKFQDGMTNEFQTLQDKYNGLIESSSALEGEVDSLTGINAQLNAELKDAKESLENKCRELNCLESQLVNLQGEQQPNREEQLELLTKECNILKNEKIDLEQQVKRLQQQNHDTGDLEDECSRLRNLNCMIKAKIELTETELVKVKEENCKHVRKLKTLQTDCDALRIENVSLSDTKTDMEMEAKKYDKILADQTAVAARVELDFGRTISMRDDLQNQNTKLLEHVEDLRKQADIAKSSLEELKSGSNALKVTFDTKRNTDVWAKSSEGRVTNLTERNSFNSVQGRPNQTQPQPVAGVQTPQNTSPGETPALSSFSNFSFSPRPSSFANGITPRPRATIQSMDDQLKRIKFAKERAMRTLKNVSNLEQKSTPFGSSAEKSMPQQQARGKSHLDETEEFVKNILDSCGKQALSA